jgi:DNA-binding protein HU-beta
MNKSELVNAVAARLDADHKSTAAVLDAVVDEIVAEVTRGGRVSLVGFGTFERRARGARTARNPRTGEAVKVKKRNVAAFKVGATFKDTVASGKVPRKAAAKKAAPAKGAAKKAAPTKAAAKKAAPAKKATPAKAAAKKAPAKKAPAKKAPAKKSVAKKAPAKRSR